MWIVFFLLPRDSPPVGFVSRCQRRGAIYVNSKSEIYTGKVEFCEETIQVFLMVNLSVVQVLLIQNDPRFVVV